ncbi:polysaccharide biosynthesis tyrosine autokinase [Desulfobacula phenolica]|uniref:Exopolysaccharide/PEP-CTERM locus tyrosine autokinase n=1 Tax=Desulfobacula phenolica TaxID=90732 RepID=A0A1H2EN09_9BACT|nr:polysaccharide biosynthesis tyrosine autokinase [Desulfobacula phenolica]SDT96572.1 exopolysaccharide/PEP-CTERM locus tyrosine autokinase [Desulfobacula phenolica]
MGKIYNAFKKKESEVFDSVMDDGTEPVPEETEYEFCISDADTSISEPYEEIPEKEVMPGNIDPSLVTVHSPHSIESEQFRLLKNNILFPEIGTPPKSIMITSPSPDEGKSFVAANLAISIAGSIDEHVLLMDCDLRLPTIHKLFGLPDTKGLSDHLSTAISLNDLLLKTFIPKLTILPGGTIPRNPSELLSSGQMRSLIHEVKLRYRDRYIIIDTPPPYITSEGNALARQVDGIIVIIRHGKTRIKDVQDIINIYGKEKIIGVVHNFAEKRPGYGYGYYKYGYGTVK